MSVRFASFLRFCIIEGGLHSISEIIFRPLLGHLLRRGRDKPMPVRRTFRTTAVTKWK
jgi:hypothetical protein